MNYSNIICGSFLKRVNRFLALCRVDGAEELVHVRNTGRCDTVLTEGAEVSLMDCKSPSRKTRFDLIAVNAKQLGWVNIDSTAPNKAVHEWLIKQGYTVIKPEFTYGASRLDFYMEREDEKYLMEVKGCTLQREGIGYFPDAPTERGIKHIRELARAAESGYHAVLAFVIQMNGIKEVKPNDRIQPEFGIVLDEARAAGVRVLFLRCRAEEDILEIISHEYND